MSIFERIKDLCEDFALCRVAFLGAHQRAKDVLEAVKNRLDAERAQVSARIAELEAQQQDPERSETVRRMAAVELAQLQQTRTYVATEEERAAFAEAISDAETAIQDLRQLKGKLRQAFNDLDSEIKRLRAETLGNQGADLYGNWLEGVQRDFVRLVVG